MRQVNKDKGTSNVVSPKFGKSKSKEVAFNCDCCGDAVTVDELTTNHVTQIVRDLVSDAEEEQTCGGDIGNVVKVRILGRRFDLFVFESEEEAYEMANL